MCVCVYTIFYWLIQALFYTSVKMELRSHNRAVFLPLIYASERALINDFAGNQCNLKKYANSLVAFFPESPSRGPDERKRPLDVLEVWNYP